MEQVYRTFTLRSTGAKSRVETFDGREHVVVPVIALVEGVIQAMNAPEPELVLYERFSVAPSGWNGRPIFLNHPMDGNTPVSGNSPSVLVRSMGKVFNAAAGNKRLSMEAWLDVAACQALGGKEEKLLDRVKANKSIEISTGAFIVLEDKKGVFNGTKYSGVWDIIIPDHLAILEEGATGACSYKMGCGIRAAVAYEMKDDTLIPLYKVGSSKTMENKDKNTTGKESAQRSMMRRFAEFVGLMNPEDMGDSDLRETLYGALRAADPAFRYSGDITIVYPKRSLVVYQMYEPEGICYYQRSYTLDETSGEATLGDAVIECERVTTYEPLEGQDELTAAMSNLIALAGARHSNKDQKMVQNLHDTSVTLGAACGEVKAAASGTCGCGNHAAVAQPATW